MIGYKESANFYIAKYNRSRATIAKWGRQGAPMDDEKLMIEYIKSRQAYSTPRDDFPEPILPPVASGHTGVPLRAGEVSPIGQPPPVGNGSAAMSEIGLKREKAAVDLELSRHKLSIAKAQVVSREKVREAGINIGAILDASLTAVEQEIPGVCAGLSEIELKQKLPVFFIRIRKELKNNLQKYLEENEQSLN